jgi:hypothetical protein
MRNQPSTAGALTNIMERLRPSLSSSGLMSRQPAGIPRDTRDAEERQAIDYIGTEAFLRESAGQKKNPFLSYTHKSITVFESGYHWSLNFPRGSMQRTRKEIP